LLLIRKASSIVVTVIVRVVQQESFLRRIPIGELSVPTTASPNDTVAGARTNLESQLSPGLKPGAPPDPPLPPSGVGVEPSSEHAVRRATSRAPILVIAADVR
jgi:hypothetical protein